MPRKLDPTLLHAITPPAFNRTKVHRAELVDRIHASLDRSLVVVATPAGYGKTTLLSDLTAHTDLKVCWVRIVGETVDAVSLAQLIALSLQKKFRKAARSATPRYSAGASPDSTMVLSPLLTNLSG
jgi:LuxR family maltose regulon positive regulatory protein